MNPAAPPPRPSHRPVGSVHASAIQPLLAVLPGYHAATDPATELDGPILLHLRPPRGKRALVVAVQRLPQVRLEDLQARLALAVLHLGARAVDGEPVAVVSVPRWSERARSAAATFMARYASDTGWALVSDDGGVALHVPGIGLHAEQPPGPRAPLPAAGRQSLRLFTDANRWMLKLLLLADAPPALWGGPRAAIDGIPALRAAAGVAPETAYRLVRALAASGFARSERGRFRLVRTDALLRAWLDHERLESQPWQPVRWLYGKPRDLAEVLARSTPGPRYAVGGFEACRALGLLHAASPGPQVHVECDLETAMSTWQLEPAPAADAHLLVAKARHPLAIFGGIVQRDDVAVVDALQAALDVAAHPARGIEQAEYVLRHGLGLEVAR